MGRLWTGCVLLLLFVPVAAVAATLEEQFESANEALATGGAATAISAYEGLIRDYGVKSPALFYNLGLAAAKDENWGLAVWGFEKALRSAPSEQLASDAEHNLSEVFAVLQARTGKTDWRSGEAMSPGGWPSLRGMKRALEGIALGVGILGVLLFYKRQKGWGLVLYGLLLMILFLTPGETARERTGVILRSAPLLSGSHRTAEPVSDSVPAGQMIRLIDETHPEFVRVDLPSGEDGWLPRSTIREL